MAKNKYNVCKEVDVKNSKVTFNLFEVDLSIPSATANAQLSKLRELYEAEKLEINIIINNTIRIFLNILLIFLTYFLLFKIS